MQNNKAEIEIVRDFIENRLYFRYWDGWMDVIRNSVRVS